MERRGWWGRDRRERERGAHKLRHVRKCVSVIGAKDPHACDVSDIFWRQFAFRSCGYW
jgi:hypothetical protein